MPRGGLFQRKPAVQQDPKATPDAKVEQEDPKAAVKRQAEARKRNAADAAGVGTSGAVQADRERARVAAEGRTAFLLPLLTMQLGGSKDLGTGGGSSYAKIVSTFAAYRKALEAGDVQGQRSNLTAVQGMARLWLNDPEHKGADLQTDNRRRSLDQLVDAAAAEDVALRKQAGQELYLAALGAGQGSAYTDEKQARVSAAYENRFTAAMDESRGAAAESMNGWASRAPTILTDEDDPEKLRYEKFVADMEAHGVSTAEAAALYTYTNQDYRYINPGTANDKGWMEGTKSSGVLPSIKGKDSKVLQEEAGAHSAVAMQGAEKLPAFSGTTYRGDSRKLTELPSMKLGVGNVLTLPNLTSSSKRVGATDAYSKASDQSVVVLWEYQDCGRDIAAFSKHKDEQEVLLLVGDRVKITSVVEVTGQEDASRGGPLMAQAVKVRNSSKAAKVFAVKAVGVGKPPPPPQRPRKQAPPPKRPSAPPPVGGP